MIRTKPSLLDAFCGAGGATRGYQLAGFHVTGVDIRPQPHYIGDAFVQADALDYIAEHGREFDAIHASPPCQGYANVTLWRGSHEDHPKLIAPTREALLDVGRPYVIESVRQRVLIGATRLCGTQFGLRVIRHRYFETSWPLPMLTAPCQHVDTVPFDHGGTVTESAYRDALEVPWMTARSARQAIPPAMTEWIGRHLRLAGAGRDVGVLGAGNHPRPASA